MFGASVSHDNTERVGYPQNSRYRHCGRLRAGNECDGRRGRSAGEGSKHSLEMEKRVSALIDMIEAGTLAAGPVVPAICRAALAFADEDYAGCVRILKPVASEVVRVGGSGAQRELMDDMLLLALMRSGNATEAGALLDRRLHRRPSPRDKAWHGRLAA